MPQTSLNVIALISGGKDSLFSLLHCIENGHKIICLANLYPTSPASSEGPTNTATAEGEDLNSFMYQTVGHTVIPLYAEALSMPLYRCQIRGEAINKERYYVLTEHDETEDLFSLLQEIKQAHPEINALSTGAILSTYQRTRIESIAVRLGLTPIAFLWQYPTLPPPVERGDSLTGLLDDMEAAGCDARFVKITSAGISDALLWSRVSSPSVKRHLVAGMSRFTGGDESALRSAVLGEGGEYETLAVNGPPLVWKKRIEIASRSNVVVQDEGGAARLAPGKASLVEQSPAQADGKSPLVRVPVPLDALFGLLREELLQAVNHTADPLNSDDFGASACPKLLQNASQVSASLVINNMTDARPSSNVTEQITAVFDQLHSLLEVTVDPTEATPIIISTTVLLRHLSDFAAVNTVYGERVKDVNPPARVTICCGDDLPKDVLVSVSFTLTRKTSARTTGLHVQSISYWAPANIGPYSQAINVPASVYGECEEQIAYVAGQIPLVPSSMQLLEGNFLDQAILSLQHLWRVGQCVGVDWWTHGVVYLADAEIREVRRRAKVAWLVWRGANVTALNGATDDDNEDDGLDANEVLDPWDLKHNHQTQKHPQPPRRSVTSNLHTLPNRNTLRRAPSARQAPNSPTTTVPPFLAAHVVSLPRSAPLEWHSLGLAHLPEYPATKSGLTISTEEDNHISISTCRLEVVEPSSEPDTDPGADGDDGDAMFPHQPQLVPHVHEIDFFTLQIAALEEGASSSNLEKWLEAGLCRLEAQRAGDDGMEEGEEDKEGPSQSKTTPQGRRWRFTALTIYTCSQAGHDAVTATGLAGSGCLIPCRSLWGPEATRLEIAVLGRRERQREAKEK